MGAVGRCAAVTTHAHDGGTAGEHALNAEAGPGSDAVAEFFEERIPAVIDGEKQLCGTWNIHAAEYKTGLMACKPSESRSDDARPVRALLFRPVAVSPLLTLILMNRKKFIRSREATCRSWTSPSFLIKNGRRPLLLRKTGCSH